MIGRFIDSLRGQLVLLIVATLAIAQIFSLWLFVDERSLAVQTAQGLEAAGRAANVATLIERKTRYTVLLRPMSPRCAMRHHPSFMPPSCARPIRPWCNFRWQIGLRWTMTITTTAGASQTGSMHLSDRTVVVRSGSKFMKPRTPCSQ